jgi:hypothetical protein
MKNCKNCSTIIKYHTDWNKIPDLCKPCIIKEKDKWKKKPCKCCTRSIDYQTDWKFEPIYCKSCKERFAKKSVSCSQCGSNFDLTTSLQIKCHKNGWSLPKKCHQCKHDALLIKGAIGALRDKFPFALEATIKKRGFIFTDKVAIVKNKKTGETVAEVKMDTEGFIFLKRVAVAKNIKTGKKISSTYNGVDGFFFQERVANTYDQNTGKRTHKTKNVKKGFIFQKTVAETESIKNSGKKTITRTKKRGFIFPEEYIDSDK